MSAGFRWLLDIELPGSTLRYSTEDLGVGLLRYRSGLGDLEAGEAEPDLDLLILDPTQDWPALSRFLDGARVILRRWEVDSDIAQAETYARGSVSQAEVETARDPVEFTILDGGDCEQVPIPDRRAIVNSRTSPDADPVGLEIPNGQVGLYYPVVFGAPGYAPELRSDGNPWPVVPIPLRQYPIAFGPVIDQAFTLAQAVVSEDLATCHPATVFVRDNESLDEGLQTVTPTRDNLGKRIAVCDFSLTPDALPFGDESALLAGYVPGPGIRGAYDVLEYALRRWGTDSYDRERLPEVRDHLDGFLVDTWLSAEVEGGIWRWIEDTFLDTLPVAIRVSTRGRYFLPLRYTVDPRRTVREVRVGRGATRLGPKRIEFGGGLDAPVNDLRVIYRDIGEFYADGVSVGVDDGVGTIGHRLCLVSQGRYGLRSGLPIELAWSWDPTTATLVAGWHLERDALPGDGLRLRVPEAWRLREGDQVALVDDELGIDDLAIVVEPPLAGSPAGVATHFWIPGR